MSAKPQITVTLSYRDGSVGLRINLRCHGIGGASADISSNTSLSIDEARSLAAAIVSQCDAEQVRVDAKAAADDRRRKWRDREIAGGRMKVMTVGQFLWP